MKFKAKTVIVTGASNGIGKGIAEHFGASGANVVVNYRSDKDGAMDTAKKIENAGGKALVFQADVTDFEACKTMVDKTIETFGQLDILVNNSGITRDQLLLRMSEDDFDFVINTNLKGTWSMIKLASRPMLKQRSGRIINISSVVALIGNAGQSNYVASKAGVIGLTKSLAKEFGKKNVTVNAVAPGFIETKMTEKLTDEIKQFYLSQIPLNDFGTVDDIAHTVLFLASDEARYITGQIINVNGGMIG